ncbi:HEAT repeat domain-containing protein [Micrococcus terreus]|uniref:HEAT repeat domain-containing protein n=1 Tax=Micrococcus terreus TaxID=574650 RepID=UPI0033E9C687
MSERAEWDLSLPASGAERDAAMIRAAADTLGEARLADWAVRLLTGAARVGDPADPDPVLIGAVPGWMPYWSRVWGARVLLHVWPSRAGVAESAVLAGLSDEEWRVRVLCAQITAVHGVRGAEETLMTLTGDPVPHVRSAAARALGEVGSDRAAPTLDQLMMDPDSVLADAAETALARLAERLDRPDLRPDSEY